MNEALRSGLDHLGDAIAEVKPRFRGWLHLGIAPLTLAAGIVLVSLSPTTATKVGAAVFTGSALVLFTVSAIYHTGNWSPRVWAFLRRFDHSNIFLLIAGSYTPFSLLLLEGTERVALLATVWTGAILGVLFRVFWTDAPRWLYVPIYVALGWAAVFFIPSFYAGATRLGFGIGVATFVHDRGRRRALHAGRGGLRLQAPQPVAALVRLPRGVPHASRSWPSPPTTWASRSPPTPCADRGITRPAPPPRRRTAGRGAPGQGGHRDAGRGEHDREQQPAG